MNRSPMVRATLRHRNTVLAFAAVAASLAAAPPCAAQMRVEVTPFVGAYLPRAGLASDTVRESGIDTYDLNGATVRQTSALIGGAQVGAWLGKQVAAEIAGGFSPSGTVTRHYACGGLVTEPFPSGCIVSAPQAAYVVMGGARLLVTSAPARLGRPALYVVAGWSVINRGGSGLDAAEQISGHALQRTYWGPIIGIGVRMPRTPTRGPRVELLRVQPGGQPQADWVLSVGLSVTLRGPSAPSTSTEQGQ